MDRLAKYSHRERFDTKEFLRLAFDEVDPENEARLVVRGRPDSFAADYRHVQAEIEEAATRAGHQCGEAYVIRMKAAAS